MTTLETLEIPVLYCSQTGNAADAAEDLANSLPSRLSTPITKITSRAITLDDFLEIALRTPSSTDTTHGVMPLIFCVVCSSYGVGQAPLGGYKFRDLCDYILASNDDSISSLWDGCQYAILGLGDSKYTTYFLNPIALDGGLSKAGAVRVGKFGRADVSGKDKIQADVIKEWSEGIISDLSLTLKERQYKKSSGDDSGQGGKLHETMAARTLDICGKIFEDWDEGLEILQKQQKKDATIGMVVGLIPIVFVFILVFFFMKTTDGDKTAAEL